MIHTFTLQTCFCTDNDKGAITCGIICYSALDASIWPIYKNKTHALVFAMCKL